VCGGDLRVGGIAAPDQYQVGVEQIVGGTGEEDLAAGHRRAGMVVAEFGVHLQDQRIKDETAAVQPHHEAAVRRAAAGVPHDGFRAVVGQHGVHALRDLA
jgi:hypothetical protein